MGFFDQISELSRKSNWLKNSFKDRESEINELTNEDLEFIYDFTFNDEGSFDEALAKIEQLRSEAAETIEIKATPGLDAYNEAKSTANEGDNYDSMKAAFEEAVDNTYQDAVEEMHGFHGQGNPVNYVRTGALGETARRTGVSSGGNTASGEVYLDQGISYNTGTFSGSQVIESAEINNHGILGRGGFWARTEAKAQDNLDTSMGKRFK